MVMCPSDCNHEETAEDLVHALRLRKRRPPEREEAWDQQLGEGCSEGRWRRAGEAPSSYGDGCNPWAASSTARQGSGGEEEDKEGEGQRQKRKKEEVQGEIQKEEYKQFRGCFGKVAPGRQQAPVGGGKDARGSLQRYGAGSLGEDQKQSGEDGTPLCEKERTEIDQQFRVIQQQLKRRPLRRRGRHDLHSGRQSAGDCRGVPRGTGKSSPGTNAVKPPSKLGRRREDSGSARHRRPVLPTGAPEESYGCSSQGAVDPVRNGRSLDQGQAVTGARPCVAALEDRGSNVGRQSLVGVTKVRTATAGNRAV